MKIDGEAIWGLFVLCFLFFLLVLFLFYFLLLRFKSCKIEMEFGNDIFNPNFLCRDSSMDVEFRVHILSRWDLWEAKEDSEFDFRASRLSLVCIIFINNLPKFFLFIWDGNHKYLCIKVFHFFFIKPFSFLNISLILAFILNVE